MSILSHLASNIYDKYNEPIAKTNMLSYRNNLYYKVYILTFENRNIKILNK